MYRDNGRKSLITKTPVKHRNDDLMPRPSLSVQRPRVADNRFSLVPGAVGRMSTMGQARPSMAVAGLSGRASTLALPNSNNRRCLQIPGASVSRDSRPLSDRARQTEMARRVFEYLNSREVPFPYSEKMIRLPSNKNEFKLIFEFLMREVDEDFQIGRIEDEVPMILAALGFPNGIKNSTMITITAPHSWPGLLAALDWLITDVIQLSQSDESFIDEDMQLPYSYFTTCFVKKRTETATQPDYSSELEKFKELMCDNQNGRGVEESFRYHYNQRIENEAQLKHLQTEMETEKCQIAIAEGKLRDFEHDIAVMQKYKKDIHLVLARKDEENKAHEVMLQKMADALADINSQIQEKEALINVQKLSADEVRAIHNKSKKLKASLTLARQDLRQAEEKVDELQPLVYKQSTVIHGKYKKFLINIQDLCEKYLPKEQHEALDWMHYEYDSVWAEFSRDSKCALSDLISQLKGGMEDMMNRYREEKRQFELTTETSNKKIRDINTQKLQDDQEHKLKFEREARNVSNIEEQIQRAEIDRGLVIDKHRLAKAEYEAIRHTLMSASERLAKAEKIYTSHRNDLERAFNEILAVVTDKISLLYAKIEQIDEQKQNWMKLGRDVLERSTKELEGLRQKKRASIGADITNLSTFSENKKQ